MSIDIIACIRDLLYQEKMAIIEGLGMIAAEYQSAEIDHRTRTIKPPKYRYVFEDKIRESNGDLEALIQHRYTLDKQQSVLLVEKLCKSIKAHLSNGKQIRLAGIGALQAKDEKILLVETEQTVDPFSAYLPTVILPQSTGDRHQAKVEIESSKSSVVDKNHVELSTTNKAEAREELKQEKEAIKQPVKETTEVESSVNHTNDHGDKIKDTPTEKPKKSRKKFSYILLSLVLIGFLSVLAWGTYYFNPSVNQFVNGLLNTSNTEETNASTHNETMKDTQEIAEKSIEDRQSKGISDEPKTCAIMVGLFSNSANVARLTKIIEQEGYKSYKENSGGTTKLGIYCDCQRYSNELQFARSKIAKDAFFKKL